MYPHNASVASRGFGIRQRDLAWVSNHSMMKQCGRLLTLQRDFCSGYDFLCSAKSCKSTALLCFSFTSHFALTGRQASRSSIQKIRKDLDTTLCVQIVIEDRSSQNNC